MDFKVAGTVDGITAIQLDIKAEGLAHNLMVEALERARELDLRSSKRWPRQSASPDPN